MNDVLRKTACFVCFWIFVDIFCIAQISSASDFLWTSQVGATTYPARKAVFYVVDYGAKGDAVSLNTTFIQKAIDEAEAAGGGIVEFAPGIYLTGSLFLGNNVNLHIGKGVTLIGSLRLADYKKIPTRVAGVEMEWPAALVNVIGKHNAAISGMGTIHGRGKVFWDTYWQMRKKYEKKGLRWIVDYDCERPRGILVSDSKNITIKDIVLYQPGFWSLHVLYSKYVTIDNIVISNNIEGHGPSTDGIDIDSSEYILVQNSDINCNDDNFCLKAGRDSDGLRVNRPCQYVVIRNCLARSGGGMFTCGSETSGGIRHVLVSGMKGIGTKCGLRFKSTCQRGGIIENIYLNQIEMQDVARPFVVDMNWNPAYSTSKLPKEYEGQPLPEHWLKMLELVPLDKGTPVFRKITLEDVKAIRATTCMKVEGIENSQVADVVLKDVYLQGKNAGNIVWAERWSIDNFAVKAKDSLVVRDCNGVHIP